MADGSGTTGEQRESPGTSDDPRRRRNGRLKLIFTLGIAACALVNIGFWIEKNVRIAEQTRLLRVKTALRNIEAEIRIAIESGDISPAEAAALLSVSVIPGSDLEHIPFSTVHVRSDIEPWINDGGPDSDADDDVFRNDDRILVWAEVTEGLSDQRVFVALTADHITQTMNYFPRGEYTAIELKGMREE